MATIGVRPGDALATHEVLNQPSPLEGRNLFTDHVALVEALEREGAGWAREQAEAVGAAWGGEPLEWGRLANEHLPKLRTHDRFGHRIDEVEFHPAWHKLLELASAQGLHSLPWTSDRAGAHVARTAMGLTSGQAEAGHGCPMTMTFAAVPALRAQPEIAAEWEPLLTAAGYDGELRPAAEKGNAKCGMAMTEKQGGSDVRANTTAATPVNGGGPGAEQNHLCPRSRYSAPGPPPSTGVAVVVLARTSEPPCFSVIAMPHSALAFPPARSSSGSYVVAVSRGTHSAARSGWVRSAGTAAKVIVIGQPKPASACPEQT